jgi:hypothetical protein
MSARIALQVLQREKEVADLEAMHKSVTSRLEQRLAHMETRLAKEVDRCRRLEHRCAAAHWLCPTLVLLPPLCKSALLLPGCRMQCVEAPLTDRFKRW